MSSMGGAQNVTLGAIFLERWSRPPSPRPPLDWRLALGRIGTARVEHVGEGAFRRHAPIPPTADCPSAAVCLAVAGKLDPGLACQPPSRGWCSTWGRRGVQGSAEPTFLTIILGSVARRYAIAPARASHGPAPHACAERPARLTVAQALLRHAPPQTPPPRHAAAPASSPGRNRVRGRPSVGPARSLEQFPPPSSA